MPGSILIAKNYCRNGDVIGCAFGWGIMPLRGIWIPIPAWKPRIRRCSSVEDVHPLPPSRLGPGAPTLGLSAIPFGNQYMRGMMLCCVCFVLIVFCVISVSVWLVYPRCTPDVPLMSPRCPSGCTLGVLGHAGNRCVCVGCMCPPVVPLDDRKFAHLQPSPRHLIGF